MSGVPFSVAFQPIVTPATRSVFAHEALVRGPAGEAALWVFERLATEERASFDSRIHRRALALATTLGTPGRLTLNCLPRGLDTTVGVVENTLAESVGGGLTGDRVVLEVTEEEAIGDPGRFAEGVSRCRASGIGIALDDFGAGYAGLSLLADFQPDFIKLDMHLVRGIEHRGARQAIVKATLQVSLDLGIEVIAEGVETVDEYTWLADHGVSLFQGYYFMRPAFERIEWPSSYGRTPAALDSRLSGQVSHDEIKGLTPTPTVKMQARGIGSSTMFDATSSRSAT